MTPTKSTYNIHLSPHSTLYGEFTYPAGETQVRISRDEIPHLERATEIRITAYIGNAQNLISLALLTDAITEVNIRAAKILTLPYLPYSRADRRFMPGDCNGLAVFGSLINSMGFDFVRTLDVHNFEAAAMAIEGLINVDPLPFIQRAIVRFSRRHRSQMIGILFPDEGALNRYSIPALISGNTGEFTIHRFCCRKVRDAETGKLSGFEVPTQELLAHGDFPLLIVDDICDGGGTFLGVADELNKTTERRYATQLGLYITHGIFSKGLKELGVRFDKIYTTDSVGESPYRVNKVTGPYSVDTGNLDVFPALDLLYPAQLEVTT